ncbi:MAG: hypothetical protein MUF24_02620 [Chitinophagaceae bacterium]|jgi:hypothetical protein|nr:hypothetical protein [Chitinophagaceae bacterium]
MGKGLKWSKKLVLCLITLAAAANLAAQAGNNPLIAYIGDNLPEKINKHLFIRVSTSRQLAYEGECVVAEYKLYVAVDLEGKLTRAPSYVGFASYDVPLSDVNAYTVEQKGNTLYKVYTIKRVQLFALEPGIQQLQPIELEATVRFRKDPSAFGNFGGDTLVPFTVRSSVVPVKILPLPMPQPAGYGGAVGRFELKAGMPADSQGASRTDAFLVQLSGSGNWHQIKLLPPALPNGLTLFEPAIQEELQPDAVPLAGKKSWTYKVTAATPGQYSLPGFDFVFFDPEARRYVSLRTDSFALALKNYSNPAYKPKATAKQTAATEVFSQWAVVIFPVTALLLALGLGYVWWHRKKVATAEAVQHHDKTNAHSGANTPVQPIHQKQAYTKPVVHSQPNAGRMQAYQLQQAIQDWLTLPENAAHEHRAKACELLNKAEALRYGPAILYETEMPELETLWKAFMHRPTPPRQEPEG